MAEATPTGADPLRSGRTTYRRRAAGGFAEFSHLPADERVRNTIVRLYQGQADPSPELGVAEVVGDSLLVARARLDQGVDGTSRMEGVVDALFVPVTGGEGRRQDLFSVGVEALLLWAAEHDPDGARGATIAGVERQLPDLLGSALGWIRSVTPGQAGAIGSVPVVPPAGAEPSAWFRHLAQVARVAVAIAPAAVPLRVRLVRRAGIQAGVRPDAVVLDATNMGGVAPRPEDQALAVALARTYAPLRLDRLRAIAGTAADALAALDRDREVEDYVAAHWGVEGHSGMWLDLRADGLPQSWEGSGAAALSDPRGERLAARLAGALGRCAGGVFRPRGDGAVVLEGADLALRVVLGPRPQAWQLDLLEALLGTRPWPSLRETASAGLPPAERRVVLEPLPLEDWPDDALRDLAHHTPAAFLARWRRAGSARTRIARVAGPSLGLAESAIPTDFLGELAPSRLPAMLSRVVTLLGAAAALPEVPPALVPVSWWRGTAAALLKAIPTAEERHALIDRLLLMPDDPGAAFSAEAAAALDRHATDDQIGRLLGRVGAAPPGGRIEQARVLAWLRDPGAVRQGDLPPPTPALVRTAVREDFIPASDPPLSPPGGPATSFWRYLALRLRHPGALDAARVRPWLLGGWDPSWTRALLRWGGAGPPLGVLGDLWLMGPPGALKGQAPPADPGPLLQRAVRESLSPAEPQDGRWKALTEAAVRWRRVGQALDELQTDPAAATGRWREDPEALRVVRDGLFFELLARRDSFVALAQALWEQAGVVPRPTLQPALAAATPVWIEPALMQATGGRWRRRSRPAAAVAGVPSGRSRTPEPRFHTLVFDGERLLGGGRVDRWETATGAVYYVFSSDPHPRRPPLQGLPVAPTSTEARAMLDQRFQVYASWTPGGIPTFAPPTARQPFAFTPGGDPTLVCLGVSDVPDWVGAFRAATDEGALERMLAAASTSLSAAQLRDGDAGDRPRGEGGGTRRLLVRTGALIAGAGQRAALPRRYWPWGALALALGALVWGGARLFGAGEGGPELLTRSDAVELGPEGRSACTHLSAGGLPQLAMFCAGALASPVPPGFAAAWQQAIAADRSVSPKVRARALGRLLGRLILVDYLGGRCGRPDVAMLVDPYHEPLPAPADAKAFRRDFASCLSGSEGFRRLWAGASPVGAPDPQGVLDELFNATGGLR